MSLRTRLDQILPLSMVDRFCQERMKNVFSQMKKQVMQHLLPTEGRIVGQRNKIDNQEAAISRCIRCQQCMNLKIDRMTGTCQMNLEAGPKTVLGEIHRHGGKTTDGNPGIQNGVYSSPGYLGSN